MSVTAWFYPKQPKPYSVALDIAGPWLRQEALACGVATWEGR